VLASPPARMKTAGNHPGRPGGAGPHGEVAVVYTGLVTRAIAIVLDVLLIDIAALAVAGAVGLVFAVFAISSKHHTVAWIIGGAAFVAWVIGYFTSFWTTTGQTPGSRVMHIRVVRSDGSRLRARHALVRLGAMVFSLPLFWGYWPILWSNRRRGVPDRMSGTVVVVADGETGFSAGPVR
jgi:uncharacterized RDD family membrane protein YckC